MYKHMGLVMKNLKSATRLEYGKCFVTKSQPTLQEYAANLLHDSNRSEKTSIKYFPDLHVIIVLCLVGRMEQEYALIT